MPGPSRQGRQQDLVAAFATLWEYLPEIDALNSPLPHHQDPIGDDFHGAGEGTAFREPGVADLPRIGVHEEQGPGVAGEEDSPVVQASGRGEGGGSDGGRAAHGQGLPGFAAVPRGEETSAQAKDHEPLVIHGMDAEEGAVVGGMEGAPSPALVVGSVDVSGLGGEVDAPTFGDGDGIEVIVVVLPDEAGMPGLAAVLGAQQVAVGADGDADAAIQEADIEQGAPFPGSLMDLAPGAPAIGGGEDDPVVPGGEAVALVGKGEAGEQSLGGDLGLAPGDSLSI